MSRTIAHGARWQTRVSLLLRLILGVLFVVAGVLKLRDPVRFALEISNYQLIPAASGVMAAVLPMMEILAGIALIVLPRAWRQASALLVLAMVFMFTVAVGSAYFRGINIDCGCFGGAEGPITGWTLMRNFALLLASGGILLLETKLLRASSTRLR